MVLSVTVVLILDNNVVIFTDTGINKLLRNSGTRYSFLPPDLACHVFRRPVAPRVAAVRESPAAVTYRQIRPAVAEGLLTCAAASCTCFASVDSTNRVARCHYSIISLAG
jgi:hypothetical protein